MDSATSQIGRTMSGRYYIATKMSDEKNTKNVALGFNLEPHGMDEICS